MLLVCIISVITQNWKFIHFKLLYLATILHMLLITLFSMQIYFPTNIFWPCTIALNVFCDWISKIQMKLGNICVMFPNCQNCMCWWIINTKSHLLTGKYAQIFVLGRNMFLEAHRFPQAMLFEKSPLFGTDNAREQISHHILTYYR